MSITEFFGMFALALVAAVVVALASGNNGIGMIAGIAAGAGLSFAIASGRKKREAREREQRIAEMREVMTPQPDERQK